MYCEVRDALQEHSKFGGNHEESDDADDRIGGIARNGRTVCCDFSHAKDEVVAQNTTTVWIDGKGQQGFSEKLNKMHAQMEAKGWKFGDLEIYTEDGDMKGAFVTHVRSLSTQQD